MASRKKLFNAEQVTFIWGRFTATLILVKKNIHKKKKRNKSGNLNNCGNKKATAMTFKGLLRMFMTKWQQKNGENYNTVAKMATNMAKMAIQ